MTEINVKLLSFEMPLDVLNCTIQFLLNYNLAYNSFHHLFPKYKYKSVNPEMLQVKNGQKDKKNTRQKTRRRKEKKNS